MPQLLSRGQEYEVNVLLAIRRNVSAGMECAVVGAHWGHFVRVLLDAGASVHAFEPCRANREQLRYRCPEATIYACAAGDRVERRRLWLDPGNSGNHTIVAQGALGLRISQVVQVCPLEDLLPRPLDFALFDCQGMDHLALKGMGVKAPPIAIVEHWEHGLTCAGMDADAILDSYTSELGYEREYVDDLNYALFRPGAGYRSA